MIVRWSRFLLAGALALALALPVTASDPAPAFEGPTHLAARHLYAMLEKVFTRALDVAGRSPRVKLALEFSFIDPASTMFFDFSGTVRVKVPGRAARAWLHQRLVDHKTDVFSTNGPIAFDVALTPLREDGDEFELGVGLDLSVSTPNLFVKLVCRGAGAAEAALLGPALESAAAALERLDAGVLGSALRLGVEELPGILATEGSGIAYNAFQEDRTKTFRDRLRATISAAGLVQHFALAIILTGAAKGATALGTELGTALAAALFPATTPFVTVALATRAAVWFGTTAVTVVALKVPVWWKLHRIGVLYRKVQAATGPDQAERAEEFRSYRDAVIARAVGETEHSFVPWRFLRTLINYFRVEVKYSSRAGTPEAFDMAPYQDLVDALGRRLGMMATQGGSLWAARLYYQLFDAVGELDRVPADAPALRGVWERVRAGTVGRPSEGTDSP